jgi:hypothetical protein
MAGIDTCDLWNWEIRYDNKDICDGTQWHIDIQMGTRAITSYGSNAYPGESVDDYSPAFRLFVQAMRKLLDGRSFE